MQIVSLQSLPVWNAGVDDDNDNDDNDDDYNDLSRSGTPRSALGSATFSEIVASTSVTLLHTGRTLGGLRVTVFLHCYYYHYSLPFRYLRSERLVRKGPRRRPGVRKRLGGLRIPGRGSSLQEWWQHW